MAKIDLNRIRDPLEMANRLEYMIPEACLTEAQTQRGLDMIKDLREFPESFKFEHAGLKCRITRNNYMVWCGYVEHRENIDIPNSNDDATVHGGVTYWGDGEVGFDCNHLFDLSPATFIYTLHRHWNNPIIINQSHYRTSEFAIDQAKKLARLISKLSLELTELRIKGDI